MASDGWSDMGQRAKMSDRDARATDFDRLPRLAAWITTNARFTPEDVWCEASLSEARAILAETEPLTYWEDGEGGWEKRSGYVAPTSWLASACLAESLAAFVAE